MKIGRTLECAEVMTLGRRTLYKIRTILGRNDFAGQFRKMIIRYKRAGYNINDMQQTACLVVNPDKINNFTALFNFTPAGRASDSVKAPE